MSSGPDLPIIIVTHEFFPQRGGIATYTEEIAKGAVENGRRVEVWAPRSESQADRNLPFPVIGLNLKGTQDISCQLKLARRWVARRKDIRNSIVLLTDPGPILAMRFILLFGPLAPARLALTFHGSEILKFGTSRLSKLLINRVIRKSDRISVLSRYSRSLLERHFPQSISKAVVTPGALRSSFQVPEKKKKRKPSPVVILAVGRLHPRKGQAETMEALAAMPVSIRQNIEFWIVGSGAKFGYSKELKRKASEAGFRVRFFGKVSDEKLQRLYAKADIFSLTSVNFRKSVEGFGLVYLEAAAHGLPIVANRVGGVSEAVADGKNGILVKPHDKKGLVAALTQLIQDQSLREQMGDYGRKWASQNNWTDIARELFDGLDG